MKRAVDIAYIAGIVNVGRVIEALSPAGWENTLAAAVAFFAFVITVDATRKP